MAMFPRRARLSVWQYHDRGTEKHRCKLCQRTYTRQSGISNLFAHLKSAHPREFSLTQTEAKEPDVPSSSKSTIALYFSSSATTKSRPCSSARAGDLTEKIIDWLVNSCRPLCTVADQGFVNLLSFTEPDFRVPSRTHVSSLINKRHADAKKELVTLLKTACVNGVTITTDGWTSSATQSYVTYTVHCITQE